MQFFPLGLTVGEAFLAAGTGVLAVLSFPPFGLWPLSLLSISLFLILLREQTSEKARVLGLLYGLVYGLGTMSWFFGIFGAMAISLIALFAAYFGLLATLIGVTKGRSPLSRALLTGL